MTPKHAPWFVGAIVDRRGGGMEVNCVFDDFVSFARARTVLGAAVLFASIYVSAAVPKISGTVTDLGGKPIANSTVIVENKATHHSISVRTDEQGRFVVRNLKGSDYSIFVVADSAQDGFRLQLDRPPAKALRHHSSTKAAAAATLVPTLLPSEGH